jgi:hypothetical protein
MVRVYSFLTGRNAAIHHRGAEGAEDAQRVLNLIQASAPSPRALRLCGELPVALSSRMSRPYLMVSPFLSSFSCLHSSVYLRSSVASSGIELQSSGARGA